MNLHHHFYLDDMTLEYFFFAIIFVKVDTDFHQYDFYYKILTHFDSLFSIDKIGLN